MDLRQIADSLVASIATDDDEDAPHDPAVAWRAAGVQDAANYLRELAGDPAATPKRLEA